jgi:sec-independent protein translocase protein TatB
MFSLGLPELLIIALLALFFVAPGDIPKLMYSLGKIIKRLSYIRYAFSQQFEDFMQESELKEMQDKAAKRTDNDLKDRNDKRT